MAVLHILAIPLNPIFRIKNPFYCGKSECVRCAIHEIDCVKYVSLSCDMRVLQIAGSCPSPYHNSESGSSKPPFHHFSKAPVTLN